jgi:hypothetical protein
VGVPHDGNAGASPVVVAAQVACSIAIPEISTCREPSLHLEKRKYSRHTTAANHAHFLFHLPGAILIYRSTMCQLESGSNSLIAVAISDVDLPKSFWSRTPSWLMMNVITPELPYSAG